MAQTTRGLRSVLSVPAVDEAFQQVVGSPRVRRKLVENYVKPTSGLRVLDVGCGPGDLIEHLPSVAYIGTDLSAAYIASARRRFGDRGRYYVGRVEDLDPEESVSLTSSSPRACCTTSTRTRHCTCSTSLPAPLRRAVAS